MADEKQQEFDPTNIRHLRAMLALIVDDPEAIDTDTLRRFLIRVCDHSIKLEAGMRELAKRIVALEGGDKKPTPPPANGANGKSVPSSAPSTQAPPPAPLDAAAVVAKQEAMVPPEVKAAWAAQGVQMPAVPPPNPPAAQPSEPV